MNLLVTGASGFIGRNFLLHAPRNWNIVAIFNRDQTFPDFVDKNNLYNVTVIKCDLTQNDEVNNLCDKVGKNIEVCIYFAGNTDPAKSVDDPVYDLLNNTHALVNFLSNLKISRLIFFSSGAVYEGLKGKVNPYVNLNPTLPYAISKLASEHYVKFFHERKRSVEEYVILRFFGAYGPFEPSRKIYTKLVRRFYIERESKFTVRGDGKNLIDAMYVEDTVNGLMKIVQSEEKNVIVDYCCGNPMTIDELVLRAAKIFGVTNPKIDHEGRVEEYNQFFASPAEMERLFGVKPSVPLEVGLIKLAEYLEKSTYER
jgi:nucleoside-diphosphate-sugar epimerase